MVCVVKNRSERRWGKSQIELVVSKRFAVAKGKVGTHMPRFAEANKVCGSVCEMNNLMSNGVCATET